MAESIEVIEAREKKDDKIFFVERVKTMPLLIEWANDEIGEVEKFTPLVDPKIIMSPRVAFFCKKEVVDKKEAIGRICSEIIALCPPGISVLLPGELIREEHMPYLTKFKSIEVVKN